MNDKPDHHALYQSISDLIDYCRDNDLPETKDMLTVTIAILCQEEGAANSLANRKLEIWGCPQTVLDSYVDEAAVQSVEASSF